MIYFIHGDSNLISDKAQEIISGALKKRPESLIYKISDETFDNSGFDEVLFGQSLFSPKYIVYISKVFSEKPEAGEYLVSKIGEMKSSEHLFVWTENAVDKKTLEKIEKNSEKFQEIKKGRESFEGQNRQNVKISPFAMTDAFGERDAKKMWLLYLEAKEVLEAEEIFGAIWWQLKSMIVAKSAKTADEAGLKPFVYQKSKRFSAKFSEEELNKMADEMMKIYHESRRGGADLSIRLEKFILQIG